MIDRVCSVLIAMLLVPLLATGASAQSTPFGAIRAGDIDGFGWGTGAALNNACVAPVNVDGLGILGALDFLPDTNTDGYVGSNSPDNWDNRTALEDGGTSVTGSGFTLFNLTSGSQYTDITLSDSYNGCCPGTNTFPDTTNGVTLPNDAFFTFNFHVDTSDIIQGQQLFLNAAFGDLDNPTPGVTVTPATGPQFTQGLARLQSLPVTCLPNVISGVPNDGLIQYVTLPLSFDQVFTAEVLPNPPGWRGNVGVQFTGEFYIALDYAEISTIPAVNGCTSAPTSLVARYPFDFSVSLFTKTREIVARLDGTRHGGATIVAAGRVGGAVSLDGIDGYVSAPPNPVFDADASGISFDAWVFVEPTGFGGPIVSRATNGPDQIVYSLFIVGASGSRELTFQIEDNALGVAYVLDGDAAISDGAWVHIAATLAPVEAGGFEAEFWVDGVSSGLVTGGFGDVAASPAKGDLLIGAYPSFGSFFDGEIDELEIYEGILPAQAVLDIQAAGAFGKCRCASVDGRLSAWWRGDGNLDDAIFNINDGIALLGGAGYLPGRVGQAFALDGIDDAVQLPNLGPHTESFGVDAWVRFTGPSVAAVDPILDKRSGTGRGYFLYLANGVLSISLQDDELGPPVVLSAGGNVADGLWHHVAAEVVRTGTPSTTLFVDGLPVGSLASAPPGSLANSANLLVGSSYDVVPQFFEGQIDEIEYWTGPESVGGPPFNTVMAAITQAGGLGKCDPAVVFDISEGPSDGGGVFIGFGNQLMIAATLGVGLSPDEVAGEIAGAINASLAAQAAGLSAAAVGSRVLLEGGAAVEITWTDTGIYLSGVSAAELAVSVPGVAGWLLGALAMLLAGTGIRARRFV